MFNTLEFWVWVVSILLAALYMFGGIVKALLPIGDLHKMQMRWATDVSKTLVRFIGWAEIAGAVGLILPVWTGILPWLTSLAALGLTIIQILAISFHARRKETGQTLPLNLFFMALSVFVLWARRGLLGL